MGLAYEVRRLRRRNVVNFIFYLVTNSNILKIIFHFGLQLSILHSDYFECYLN
jgi:hypothetical protein